MHVTTWSLPCFKDRMRFLCFRSSKLNTSHWNQKVLLWFHLTTKHFFQQSSGLFMWSSKILFYGELRLSVCSHILVQCSHDDGHINISIKQCERGQRLPWIPLQCHGLWCVFLFEWSLVTVHFSEAYQYSSIVCFYLFWFCFVFFYLKIH